MLVIYNQSAHGINFNFSYFHSMFSRYLFQNRAKIKCNGSDAVKTVLFVTGIFCYDIFEKIIKRLINQVKIIGVFVYMLTGKSGKRCAVAVCNRMLIHSI